MNLRGVEIDLTNEKWRIKEYQASGIVEIGVMLNIAAETFKLDPSDPQNITVLGFGPFVRNTFGSSRAVMVFRSPLSRGLHVSTAGGIGYSMIRMGAYFIALRGRAEEPVIVGIEGDKNGVKDVWFEKVPKNMLVKSTFEFSREISQRYKDEINRGDVVFTGPKNSVFASALTIRETELGPIPDLFGRGGAGYALSKHNVKAIIGYGEYDAENLLNFELLIKEVLGSVAAVTKATTKYRYDPKLGTGGTFGVNYVHYKDLVPMLTYDTIYMDYEERMKYVKRVLEEFWKPFQECIKGRMWKTCGEPCPAVCKKMWRGHKVDYEPYHAVGPYVGNFSLEKAAKFVEIIDGLGLDAIESGHVIGFVLKAVMEGLLEPHEVQFDGVPTWEEDTSPFVEKVLEQMKKDEGLVGEIMRHGLRRTIHRLNEEMKERIYATGKRFNDLIPYASFGEEGYMTPNYYWSPGVVSPVYILGRYWINYSPTFEDPKTFAYQCYIRALNELMIDNAGFCRFHRKWAEKVLREAYARLGIDIASVSAEIYKNIASYNKLAGAEPRPWESKKAMDIVATIARVMKHSEWAQRFERGEGYAWWNEFKKEFDKYVFYEEG